MHAVDRRRRMARAGNARGPWVLSRLRFLERPADARFNMD